MTLGQFLLVLVIPNISPFLAAELYPLPSAAKIEQERFSIEETERDQILRERWKETQQTKYQDLQSLIVLPRPEIEARLAGDPSLRARYEEYSREYEEVIRQVNRQQRAKSERMSETFEERSKYQVQLARILTSFSPCANFVFVATDLTETGIEADNTWGRQAGAYNREMGGYAEVRYQKEKEKNPAYDSNDYLDLRGRPRFVYHRSALSERIADTAVQLGILLLFMSAFLGVGFVAFHRYDVR